MDKYTLVLYEDDVFISIREAGSMEYGHLRQQAKDFIIPNEVTHTSSTRMAYLLIKTDSVARVLVYSITNRRRQVEVNGVLNWNRVPPEHHGFLPAEIGFLFL